MEPSLPLVSTKSSSFLFPSSRRARVFPIPSDTHPLPSFSSLPNPNPIHRSSSDLSASAPMDYRYRAAEERNPLLSSSSSSSTSAVSGYFMQEALRAGYIDIGGDIRRGDFMESISSRETLQGELQKERIREELILREIAQRRILEEQARREVELEQATAMRRLQMERYSSVAGAPVHAEVGLDRGMQFGPEARILDRFGSLQVPRYPEDTINEWTYPPPPLPSHQLPPHPVVGRKLSLPRCQPEVSPCREVQT